MTSPGVWPLLGAKSLKSWAVSTGGSMPVVSDRFCRASLSFLDTMGKSPFLLSAS